jgi:hypothetical protein
MKTIMSLTAASQIRSQNGRRDARSAAVTESLRTALQGSNAGWLRAAIRRAESDPLAAALDASVLAAALALRATEFLDAEMRRRDAELLQETAA